MSETMPTTDTTRWTDDQLKDLIGVVALDEYRQAEDWARPKLDEWIGRLRDLTDDEFAGECTRRIYDSALVSSFRGNWSGDHCLASACFHESRRRQVAAGHDADCGGSIYARAHTDLMRGHGYAPTGDGSCTCGISSEAESSRGGES